MPATLGELSRGTLVLRAVLDSALDGFRFERVGARRSDARGERVARVARVDRPGSAHDLESRRWRVLGALLVTVPGFRAAYARWTRLRRFLGKVVRPLPCPLNLGFPEDLAAGVIDKYANRGDVAYQRLLARDGLEPWEAGMLHRVVPPKSRVLVVGCVAGREVVALAERGHRVVGVDPVPALVEAARRLADERGVDVDVRVGPTDALPFSPGSFDVVLCASAVYQHTPTRRRRIALLQAMAGVLADGGVIIVYAGWDPVRGARLALVDALRALLHRLLGERFTTEPGDRLVRFLSLASDAWQPCFYHAFRAAGEIAAEIREAGLVGTVDADTPWLVRKPS